MYIYIYILYINIYILFLLFFFIFIYLFYIHVDTYKVTIKYDTIQNEMSSKEAMQSFFNRSPHLQGMLNEINREQNTNAYGMLLILSKRYCKRECRYDYLIPKNILCELTNNTLITNHRTTISLV